MLPGSHSREGVDSHPTWESYLPAQHGGSATKRHRSRRLRQLHPPVVRHRVLAVARRQPRSLGDAGQHVSASCSRRTEGDIEELGAGLAMLKSLGHYTQQRRRTARGATTFAGRIGSSSTAAELRHPPLETDTAARQHVEEGQRIGGQFRGPESLGSQPATGWPSSAARHLRERPALAQPCQALLTRSSRASAQHPG
jgi:hypothetical protein